MTEIRMDFQKTSEFAFLGLFHHVFTTIQLII